jgi:hypothetical protein
MRSFPLVFGFALIATAAIAQTYPSSKFSHIEVGVPIPGKDSWVTTWDPASQYPQLNPLQVVSPNGTRAGAFFSRQSDNPKTEGIYMPETLLTLTVIDTPPSQYNVGAWGRYDELNISTTSNVNALLAEVDVYTRVPGKFAAWSSDPFTYNGYITTGTPSYAGSTLTLSSVSSPSNYPPVVGEYLYISGITGTSGAEINGWWPIATVSGSGPYTLTFAISGVTGTAGGTATISYGGHNSGYRVGCGAGGGVGRPSPEACATGVELVPNGATFETGFLVADGALDLSTPTVASATHSSGVVTLTFSSGSPVWAVAGSPITILGATGDTAINGTFIITKTNSTTVSYAVAGSGSPTGTITIKRPFAPAYSMAEQQAVVWYGAAFTPYASIFEQSSGGSPILHVSMPQPNSAVTFEFNGSEKLALNATTLYPSSANAFNLGTSSLYFSNVYSLGYQLRDQSAAYNAGLAANSSTALTADRTLTFDLANANQTLSFGEYTQANISIAGSSGGTVTCGSCFYRYQQQGKKVVASYFINVSAVGTATGAALFVPLPVTSKGTALEVCSANVAGSGNPVAAIINTTGSGTGNVWFNITPALAAGSYIGMTCSYEAA